MRQSYHFSLSRDVRGLDLEDALAPFAVDQKTIRAVQHLRVFVVLQDDVVHVLDRVLLPEHALELRSEMLFFL